MNFLQLKQIDLILHRIFCSLFFLIEGSFKSCNSISTLPLAFIQISWLLLHFSIPAISFQFLSYLLKQKVSWLIIQIFLRSWDDKCILPIILFLDPSSLSLCSFAFFISYHFIKKMNLPIL